MKNSRKSWFSCATQKSQFLQRFRICCSLILMYHEGFVFLMVHVGCYYMPHLIWCWRREADLVDTESESAAGGEQPQEQVHRSSTAHHPTHVQADLYETGNEGRREQDSAAHQHRAVHVVPNVCSRRNCSPDFTPWQSLLRLSHAQRHEHRRRRLALHLHGNVQRQFFSNFSKSRVSGPKSRKSNGSFKSWFF